MPTATYLWQKGSNITNVSGGGSQDTQYTVRGSGNGTAYTFVKLTITTPTGFSWYNQDNFWPGTSIPEPITIQMDAPPHRFTASTFAPTATAYNWYKDQVLQGSHYDVAIFTRTSPYCGHSYLVQAEAINACGTSARRNKTVIEPACGKSLVISPNPASDFVEIDIISDANVEINSFAEFNISITDIYGLKVYSDLIRSSGKFNISVSNLKEGSYILTVINGKDVLQATIIIKH